MKMCSAGSSAAVVKKLSTITMINLLNLKTLRYINENLFIKAYFIES